MSKCQIEGCTKEATATVYCQMHYRRIRLYGEPNFTLRKQRSSTRPSEVRIQGDVAFIELTQGREAMIDLSDVAKVKRFNWYWSSSTGYAYSYRAGTSLHQHLLGRAPQGYVIDHDDRDKLNCRRYNLSFKTHSESRYNEERSYNRKECSFHKASGKYQAYTWIAGKGQVYLGLHESEQQAMEAVAAWKLMRTHHSDTEKRDE